MKTPWRFLVDLTSRGKPKPAPLPWPAPPGPAPDPAIDEAQLVSSAASVEPRETPFEAAAIAAPRPAHPVPLAEPEAESISDHPTPASQAIWQRELASADVVKPSGQSRTKRIKPDAAEAVPQFAVKANDDTQVASLPAQPLTFRDEVTSIEEEILMLRRALARKLKVQNAQLKRMLERFDVR